jgi:hypothetical protein
MIFDLASLFLFIVDAFVVKTRHGIVYDFWCFDRIMTLDMYIVLKRAFY